MNVEIDKENIRLDQFLAEKLDISRNKVQKLIDEAKITIPDRIVSASKKYPVGTNVSVNDELDFTINIEPENIPIDVVFEDDYLLVINKPSGMVVHPAPGNYIGTLVNGLLYKFNMGSTTNIRPGIVHRIDKDTSGLMIVAKTDKATELLGNMIKNHLIERQYLALVDGVIKHETGTIDAPIGRDNTDRQKMAVTENNSKDAITNFKVLKRYSDKTLIKCKLETGRTHQIRVHMAYIGYPIYNDPLYGKRKNASNFGQFLHSTSIKFIHPITKKELFFEVEPPKEFKEYIESLDSE